MTKKKERIHRGSNFHDFLKEKGIYEECRAGAMKRIIAYELELKMNKVLTSLFQPKLNKTQENQ